MTEALSGALARAHARLLQDVEEVERELKRARERCREIQREMAVAKARAGYPLEVPERMLIPDIDLAALEIRWPTIPDDARPLMAASSDGVSWPSDAASGSEEGATRRDLTCDALPAHWRRSLSALIRADVTTFSEIFARNVILRWEGDNPLSGTHLGDKQALPVLTRLAASIQPGSALVEELQETEGNLEATVVVTFVGDIPEREELATRVRCVLRFDDAGRIALLFVTPEELDVVDGFLILVEEGEPDVPADPAG